MPDGRPYRSAAETTVKQKSRDRHAEHATGHGIFIGSLVFRPHPVSGSDHSAYRPNTFTRESTGCLSTGAAAWATVLNGICACSTQLDGRPNSAETASSISGL